MKYNATEEELYMIEHGQVDKSATRAYISCTIDRSYHYLTVNGEIKRGPELEGSKAYHDTHNIAEAFLTKWIISKESQKEVEVENKPIVIEK